MEKYYTIRLEIAVYLPFNEVESDQTPQCVICLSRQAVTANVPCGHRIYCITCCHQLKNTIGLNKLMECSTCRQSLTSIIKLF